MEAYKLLFDVSVKHMYFADGWCKDTDIIPTSATNARMMAMGLLSKFSDASMEIFYNSKDKDILAAYATDSRNPLRLCFHIIPRNPLFANISKLPSANENDVYHFSNRMKPTGLETVTRLHEGEYVSSGDKINIDTIKDDSPLFDDCFEKYNFQGPFCFILVVHVTEEAFFIDKNTVASRHYSINFDVRSTYWKYYFIRGFENKNLFIKDLTNGRETEFESVSDDPDPPNKLKPDKIFRAKTALPLEERYAWNFQLKETTTIGEKVLFKRLPLADARQINKEEINGKEEFVSEIYVNC